MRRIIVILFVAAALLAIGWRIAFLPGQVTADIGGLTVMTSAPVAILALLLAFGTMYWLIRLIAAGVRLPRTVSAWRGGHRRGAGEAAVTQTLLALAAGEADDARRAAARARRMLGDTPQTLLLAAEAGRLADRTDETEGAFRALAQRKDAAFLGYRGLLRMAIAQEDWKEATVLARQAEAAHPGAAWLRRERSRLAIRSGDWADALALAEPTSSARAALAVAAAGHDPAGAARFAEQAWKSDPSLPAAVGAYAASLRKAGKDRRALAVLTRAWTAAPHPDIATAALAPLTDPLVRAQAAQRLTAANPSHAESRILLARTALDAGLTGEARHQIDAAMAEGVNQRRLWLLLAEIEEAARGDTEEGRRAQRDALHHAAMADADPAWRCESCHAEHAAWHAACPSCQTAGSLRWRAMPLTGVVVQPALFNRRSA